MRIVKHAQSTPDYQAFKASDAPFIIYRVLEEDPNGTHIRLFVSHVVGETRVGKELKPEAWMPDNATVATIVLNDLLLNMRKLSAAANEGHVVRLLTQWLSCFNVGLVPEDGYVMLQMENTTYRFTHFPRVLQIVTTLNRSIPT